MKICLFDRWGLTGVGQTPLRGSLAASVKPSRPLNQPPVKLETELQLARDWEPLSAPQNHTGNTRLFYRHFWQ
jgi:hypothetical protein